MSRSKRSYEDPTTIAYICRGCEQSVASPIVFHCKWTVVANSGRARQIRLTESWHGSILCPKCSVKNNHVYPRHTEDLFWHDP
jgi:hypothetical protein